MGDGPPGMCTQPLGEWNYASKLHLKCKLLIGKASLSNKVRAIAFWALVALFPCPSQPTIECETAPETPVQNGIAFEPLALAEKKEEGTLCPHSTNQQEWQEKEAGKNHGKPSCKTPVP